jgi:molybdenum cofactor cytidylyltransferase/nicotine blue oxidoreductase
MSPVGVLLAAGAGTRMGRPKALVRDADGVPWVLRSVDVLRAGGCTAIAVVVGAAADQVADLLAAEDVAIVPSPSWQDGVSASLKSGLAWAAATDADAAVVHLVDLPDVGADVVRRIVTAGRSNDPTQVLLRAGFHGSGGHPVLLGRAHWAGALSAAHGDRGANAYLTAAGCTLVPCEDLAEGNDRDS